MQKKWSFFIGNKFEIISVCKWCKWAQSKQQANSEQWTVRSQHNIYVKYEKHFFSQNQLDRIPCVAIIIIQRKKFIQNRRGTKRMHGYETRDYSILAIGRSDIPLYFDPLCIKFYYISIINWRVPESNWLLIIILAR